MAVCEWLAKNARNIADDKDQKRLRAVAESYFAVVRGRDPRRSERVSELMEKSLARKYGRG